MREIEEIICSCGGTPEETKTTDEERKKYGCHRDSEEWTCCVEAKMCPKCKTRWMFALAAPEME